MFSLAAFISYLSIILFSNGYYFVFFVILPVSIYLVFLEYICSKNTCKYITIYLSLGLMAGTSMGIYSGYQHGECPLDNTEQVFSATIINVSQSFYTVEINHKRHSDRLKYRRGSHDPDIFIFDHIQVICHKWSKRGHTNFFHDLENLQGIHNTCDQGQILEVRESHTRFNDARRYIQDQINASMDRFAPDSYARGFLVGNTQNLNPVELNTFRKMGIAHLFSPSGLHMGLLYASCYLPFSLLRLPLFGQLSGLVICFFYLCVLDFQIPLARSFIFILFFFILKILKRRSEAKYTLYITCILLEVIFPLSCFTVSFILSFFITLIILLFFPLFKKIIPIKFEKLKDHMAITLSASAGSCFLSLYFFNYYHPVSVLYNFLLVPPSGIYLASALLYVLLPPFQYIIIAGDFLFRQASWYHYYIFEKNLPQLNLLFCKIWLLCFFLLTIFFIYHALKKQFWYLRKYYLKFYVFLTFLFIVNYYLDHQPVAGKLAFPYGIILYRNQDLFFMGSPAQFYEKNLGKIIQNTNIPFNHIYSTEKFLKLLGQNLVHPLYPIISISFPETYGWIQWDNECFLFFPGFKFRKTSLKEYSLCKNIYLVHSKKHSPDVNYYKKVFSGLRPDIKIHQMNYAKWQWDYANDKKNKEDAI